MTDLLNIDNAENIGNAPSGLVSVPMTITGKTKHQVQETLKNLCEFSGELVRPKVYENDH